MSYKWADYDPDEVVALHQAGLSQREIGEIVGLSQTSVGYSLRRSGVQARPAHGPRRYPLNESFFERIETPEQAYWLGFITADGNVMPDGALRVALAVKDEDHVWKLKASLNSEAPIRPRPGGKNGQALLRVHSKRLVADLAKYGVKPRKTWSCEPWDAPADLAPDYWRGMVDGDGHVRAAHPTVFLCGTREMIDGFLSYAHAICGTATVPYRPARDSIIWAIQITGALQAPRLLQALYVNNGPALDRKKNVALQIVDDWLARINRPAPVCRADCDSTDILARGLCNRHYLRWRIYGDPNAPTQHGRDSSGRFNGTPGGIPETPSSNAAYKREWRQRKAG